MSSGIILSLNQDLQGVKTALPGASKNLDAEGRSYRPIEITKEELGEYIPEIRAELNALRIQDQNHFDLMIFSCVTAIVIVCAAGLFALVQAAAPFATTGMIMMPFGVAAPFYLGALALLINVGFKSQKTAQELGIAEERKQDRREDLQNESNRLWVKREQLLAMKAHDEGVQELNKKLMVIEDKFDIRPNVNSEEEYLAYWANPKNMYEGG